MFSLYFLHNVHLQRPVVSVGLVSGVVCTSQAQICHFIRRVVILTTGLWIKLISGLILTETNRVSVIILHPTVVSNSPYLLSDKKHIAGDKALPSLVTHTQTCKFNSKSAESAG